MKKVIFNALAAMSLCAAITACSTEPKTVEQRDELVRNSADVRSQFRSTDADIARHMDTAYGMAVFPKIAKGGAIVGAAGGRGVVYEQGKPIGYTIMSQGTVGAQLGGQSYSQMILFENKAALDRFTEAEWAMSAQATAVAAASGAGTTASYKDGVMVYVLNQKGLMAEASVGGQKFTFEPMGSNRMNDMDDMNDMDRDADRDMNRDMNRENDRDMNDLNREERLQNARERERVERLREELRDAERELEDNN